MAKIYVGPPEVLSLTRTYLELSPHEGEILARYLRANELTRDFAFRDAFRTFQLVCGEQEPDESHLQKVTRAEAHIHARNEEKITCRDVLSALERVWPEPFRYRNGGRLEPNPRCNVPGLMETDPMYIEH